MTAPVTPEMIAEAVKLAEQYADLSPAVAIANVRIEPLFKLSCALLALSARAAPGLQELPEEPPVEFCKGRISPPPVVLQDWQYFRAKFGTPVPHAQLSDAEIEAAAEAVHNAYLETVKRLCLPIRDAMNCAYADLQEAAKEIDRATVRAVIATVPVGKKP